MMSERTDFKRLENTSKTTSGEREEKGPMQPQEVLQGKESLRRRLAEGSREPLGR